MPSPHKKTVGTIGTILLVEEYKPLAIAFGSAVKKFTGNYETRVVASLAQAEKALRNSHPKLIVLDFDPPPRGSVDFFQRLKNSQPDARILILAAEDAPDFSQLRATPAAFQFVKKPFELASFGKTLARLLGAESPAGKMSDLSLVDMIALYALSGANLILQVEAGNAGQGEIHLAEGRILHASAMGLSGTDAFQAMVHWPSPDFAEAERHSDSPRDMQTSWVPLLTEALRSPPSISEQTAEEKAEPIPQPPAKTGKKILIVDDTELLSIFLQEILVTADPTLEVTTRLTGADGLSRIAASKPDLVLLDYSLPDVKGDEVARRLLDDPQTAAIPIIMMSGHVPEMMATAERCENIIATIPKPFLSHEMVELVAQILGGSRPKKITSKPARSKPAEPHVIEAKKSRNGRRAGPKPAVVSEPVEAEKPEPEEIRETIAEEELPGDEIPSEPLPLSYVPPVEILEPPSFAAEIPARIPAEKSNAVVLGFSLEVRSIEFSARLRIQKIRARLSSPSVSLRVLPQTLDVPGANTDFALAQVVLDAYSQIDLVRLAPVALPQSKIPRYPSAIDGVLISPREAGDTIEMIPTAVAPMLVQMLSLFELSSVELSSEFRVGHLVLKSRGEKVRITLLPDMAQTGATFDLAQIHTDTRDAITEILLQA